jgi:hypothetical protein
MWRHTVVPILAFLLVLAGAGSSSAAQSDCGQPISTGAGPTATDSLYTLRTAIGLSTCDLEVCDVDSSCSVTATDALRVLGVSIGQGVALDCSGSCFSTTTLGSTTTSTVSTTSTTLAAPTWADVMTVFDINGCAVAGCHGSVGNAGDLSDLGHPTRGYAELLSDPVDCFSSSYQSRVVPGNPGASFLLAKLEGTADCGSSMPLIGGLLLQEDRDIIRDWVLAGAPQN